MEHTGVSQKAIIFNKENKFLVIRRSRTAPYGALTWDLPGGDLNYGEDAIKGIIREIKEETDIEVQELKPFDVESHINDKKEFWVTIAYTCKATLEEIKLSYEHDKYKWINPQDIEELEASDKIKKFIKKISEEDD